MGTLQIRADGAGRFAIEGDLTFASIDKNTVKSMAFLSSAKEITIDLSQVTSTDSAGLALMIEWIRHARGKRVQLSFNNIPQQLLNLAKLSGFDHTGHFTPTDNEIVDTDPVIGA